MNGLGDGERKDTDKENERNQGESYHSRRRTVRERERESYHSKP